MQQNNFELVLKDLSETNKLGTKLGKSLIGGEVIELSGDLGSGKTTLVKSIVSASGST